MTWKPCFVETVNDGGAAELSLGHPLVDDYLRFVDARARHNTLLAVAFDLKVFFTAVPKDPPAVTTADVFAFMNAQRAPRRGPKVVRLEDGEAGLAARTIKRRLSSVSGLFAYLVARGDTGAVANPVPRGLATRRANARPGARGVPLVRSPRTLPRIPRPVGGQRAGVRLAHPPGPRHGRCDGPRRAPSLRGARPAAHRPAAR